MLLHTEISGQGQAVLLLHGLFGSYENLGVIARQLESYQVISMDLRNHGRSPWSDEMNYPAMADDVAETLAQYGIEQVVVLGHSMGGKVAMQLALSRPHLISKLILADISPVQNKPRHQAIFAGLSAVAAANVQSRQQADQLLTAYIAEAGVRAFLLKSLQKAATGFAWRFNLDVLQSCYDTILQPPAATGPYPGPTLFIKGGDSDYLLSEHQGVISTLFPQAKAKVIMGTGHWLHAEKPAAFARLVNDFLLT
ncbi:alpha/beta fold hydrolase [Rheinheimera sp.]|uniref:alpha/beta fold hydrolase n=1 Tax=Rheinheimera sp. TaxID=1869214 RepID=UPI00307DC0B0